MDSPGSGTILPPDPMSTFVIEHMEDDDDAHAMPVWVELEYRHMRALAGAGAVIHFTQLSAPLAAASLFHDPAPSHLARADAHTMGILELMRLSAVARDRVCLLDPRADQPLSPSDGDGRFTWFLFGGILGDDPPRDRTAELRELGFPTRHLGPVQMTTDTALGVTKLVAKDKVPLDAIPYVDYPTITLSPRESIEMPFRYIANGKGDPTLPPGMRELMHKDSNKSFDF